jgi:hypothetical protein
MMDFNAYGIALIPIIVALVKISNMVGVPRRWLPVIAVVLGVLGGVFYLAPDNLKEGILLGLWLGLGAVGMHSGAKNALFNGGGKGK